MKESEENEHSIGDITAVYFGEPYGDIANRQTICEANIKLQCYQCLRNKLITIVQDHKQYPKIKCFPVSIKSWNSKVKKGVEIKPDNDLTEE